MGRVARFRLGDGHVPPDAFKPVRLADTIYLERDVRYNPDPSSPTFDLDWFIVMDEEFLQPYTPFYNLLNEASDGFGFVYDVADAYNAAMREIEWLEERDMMSMAVASTEAYPLDGAVVTTTVDGDE